MIHHSDSLKYPFPFFWVQGPPANTVPKEIRRIARMLIYFFMITAIGVVLQDLAVSYFDVEWFAEIKDILIVIDPDSGNGIGMFP